MCKISSLFETVNMGVLAWEICLKMTFLGPGPTLGLANLIIVAKIQVKLISVQTCLGKVLLESVIAYLDFCLSTYSPLKISKENIEVVNLTILALCYGHICKILAKKFFCCKYFLKMSHHSKFQMFNVKTG